MDFYLIKHKMKTITASQIAAYKAAAINLSPDTRHLREEAKKILFKVRKGQIKIVEETATWELISPKRFKNALKRMALQPEDIAKVGVAARQAKAKLRGTKVFNIVDAYKIASAYNIYNAPTKPQFNHFVRSQMQEKGVDRKDVAKIIGVDYSTLNNKLNDVNGRGFTLEQAYKLYEFFKAE